MNSTEYQCGGANIVPKHLEQQFDTLPKQSEYNNIPNTETGSGDVVDQQDQWSDYDEDINEYDTKD